MYVSIYYITLYIYNVNVYGDFKPCAQNVRN